MNGTFVAQDLILFFIFFELVLLPMFFMIGVWGGPNREYASIKFFLFTLFGSALMLVSFLAHLLPVEAPDLRHGHAVAARRVRDHRRRHADAACSPACSSASRSRCRCSRSTRGCPTPTPRHRRSGSVLLAAIMLKLGTYGFIRIALPILPKGAEDVGTVDRPARGDRHHLRRVVLPRADRHEAAHRVLVGVAHGLRDARHRDADRASGSTPRSSAWSPTASSPACCSSSPARCRSATRPAR